MAKSAILPLLMPIILIGGSLSGYFTPTEAAVVAALYGCILGLASGELKLNQLPKVLFDTALGSARTMFIIGTAGLFGWILTLEQAPILFSNWLFSISTNRWIVILIINLFLLVLGMFMESSAIIIMTTPFLVPIVLSLGFDIIHFGIMMMVNVMIGCVTPPVGVLMYVTNDIAEISMREYLRFQWPFLLSLFVVLILVTAFPIISLLLPNLLL